MNNPGQCLIFGRVRYNDPSSMETTDLDQPDHVSLLPPLNRSRGDHRLASVWPASPDSRLTEWAACHVSSRALPLETQSVAISRSQGCGGFCRKWSFRKSGRLLERPNLSDEMLPFAKLLHPERD